MKRRQFLVAVSRAVMATAGLFYLRVLRDPVRYQVLCANHNWIKRAERGEHTRRLYAAS